ncbi:MAG: tetratricopeptide repeat protein [Acetobacter sp.]|nr:tetratricopeptide repeat protein [Acetobacter sp.]
MRKGFWVCAALFLVGLTAGCATESAVEQKDLLTAHVELDNGAPMPALRILRRYISNHPEDVPTLIELARANLQLRRFQPAILLYQDALRRDPSNIEAQKGLARVMLHTNPQEALKELKNLSLQAPRNAKVWVDLGIAYDTVGNHKAAQEAYYQAMKLNPLLIPAQVNLSLSYVLRGNYDLAYQTLYPLAVSGDATPRIRADFDYVSKMLEIHRQPNGTVDENVSSSPAPSLLSSDMLGGGARDSVQEERLGGVSGISSLSSESESNRNVESVIVNRAYSHRRK